MQNTAQNDADHNVGLCQCGCGHTAPIARRTNRALGHRTGHPVRFINGHNRRKSDRHAAIDSGYTSACWLWQLNKTRDGYGLVRVGRQMQVAHRYHYEQKYGPVPDGFELDHLCRVRACVNPDHLEPVSHAQNCQRGSKTKLSRCDIDAIRAAGDRQEDIARRYGITQGHVSRIKRRRTWCDSQ